MEGLSKELNCAACLREDVEGVAYRAEESERREGRLCVELVACKHVRRERRKRHYDGAGTHPRLCSCSLRRGEARIKKDTCRYKRARSII